MDITKAAAELGKIGGDKTLRKYGTSYFKRIGKMGGRPRKKFPIDKSKRIVNNVVNEPENQST